MAKLVFTSHLREVAPAGETSYEGNTVLDVLAQAFAEHERLQHYILDDQGRMRKHVCIFLDGVRLHAGDSLDRPINADSEIYVMQALSGG